ncbi:sister chromatid cohesion protein 1 [Yamadazyma tenuis]|uniref:sister chromatid cohesion protein 1 n=1 Tax=Candida tenuis TaxID=2315449 RepID=UPI00279C5143|nr:sister chromatid cohesion protein 1 [Yamadazyma tenuis]
MYTSKLQEGPLAPVWMAANYEKKLTKQQLLNTNLITSTTLLNQPISSSENITLRLSGQLLLGIVRIYSRKTKYLLDDANDILFKLKNAFKFASGGVLLGSETGHRHQNINAGRSTITNIGSITLPDRVTRYDLLYQESLSLDDVNHRRSTGDPFSLFSQKEVSVSHDGDLDHSVEYGRFNGLDNDDDDNMMHDDLDFDLDFNNFDADDSIEVGRRETSVTNPELSSFDIDTGDSGNKFGLEFDAPLETIDENEANSPPDSNEPVTPSNESTLPVKEPVDSEEKLNSGITIEELKHLQYLQLNGDWRKESAIFRLSDNDKLLLIKELSEPAGFKKRKIWDLNTELTRLCNDVSTKETNALDTIGNFDQLNEEDQFQGSFDDFNFDLSLPEFGNEEGNEIDFDEQFPQLQLDNEAASSTKQIVDLIKSENTNQAIPFETIIERDSSCSEPLPLGTIKRGNSNVLNMKKEASKCFFELLALASRDCISIQQHPGDTDTDIAKNITISTRDNLFTAFT